MTPVLLGLITLVAPRVVNGQLRNTCVWAYDGACDELDMSDTEHDIHVCAAGTDTADCAPAPAPQLPPPPPPPPPLPSPPPPPPVDCAGWWTVCTSDCEPAAQRTWSQTAAPTSGGAACPAPEDCMPGDGGCPLPPPPPPAPPPIDCAGEWSMCTIICEPAAERIWIEAQALVGDGAACPAAEDCAPGDGLCPTEPPAPPSPPPLLDDVVLYSYSHCQAGSEWLAGTQASRQVYGLDVHGCQAMGVEAEAAFSQFCVVEHTEYGDSDSPYGLGDSDRSATTECVLFTKCVVDSSAPEEASDSDNNQLHDPCVIYRTAWCDWESDGECDEITGTCPPGTDTEDCSMPPPPPRPGSVAVPLEPVDCAGSWSACTSACEPAAQRTWSQTAAPMSSGAACPVAEDCMPGDGSCPLPPTMLDCMGEWSGWGGCSHPCGPLGLQSREFHVLRPAREEQGGQPCEEEGFTQLRQCNANIACGEGRGEGEGAALVTQQEQQEQDDDDAAGEEADEAAACDGEWGEWTGCSATCGEGVRSRFFTVWSGSCANTGLAEQMPCSLAACSPTVGRAGASSLDPHVEVPELVGVDCLLHDEGCVPDTEDEPVALAVVILLAVAAVAGVCRSNLCFHVPQLGARKGFAEMDKEDDHDDVTDEDYLP